jgi:hypothetical protein
MFKREPRGNQEGIKRESRGNPSFDGGDPGLVNSYRRWLSTKGSYLEIAPRFNNQSVSQSDSDRSYFEDKITYCPLLYLFILFYFILFYLFYFIIFILFYFILFYIIIFWHLNSVSTSKIKLPSNQNNSQNNS